MTRRRDAFRLLEIPPDSDQAEVRAAFRRKAIEVHPDTGGSSDDGPTVGQLIDAYRRLSGWPEGNDESNSAVPKVGVDRASSEGSSDPTQRRCRDCMGRGLRLTVITCPVCRGSSLLTTLGVRRVSIHRCPRCHGRGRVPAVEVCRM
jgi:DnaJ-class molecular chaperone